MKKRRVIALLESDSHAGHKLGLCNPAAELIDENGLRELFSLGRFQRYLWDLRLEYINKVKKLAGRDEIIYFHNGDVTQGKKYPSQLMFDSVEYQQKLAAENVRPIYDLKNVKKGRIIAGTSSHNFGSASAELSVADRLRGMYPEKDSRALAHTLIDISGYRIDATHHGPGAGIRQWTRGNVARYYLRSVMWQEFKAGNEPADLYLRAHYHTFVWETVREQFAGKMYTCHLIVLPSWCGMTEYARQATKSQFEITNGLAALEIVGGKLVDVHPFYKTLDLRVQEKL